MSSYYSIGQLSKLGLKSFGKNVSISRHAKLYNPENIIIGNNVRIDDFCILSSKPNNPFILENYIHLAAGVHIFGGGGFIAKSFSGFSGGVKIYTIGDSYCGNYMTNPTVPYKFLNIINKQLIVGKHTIIGTSSVVLPGVNIGEGVAIGACSLVHKDCRDWNIYAGVPIKCIKPRSKKLLELEEELLNSEKLS